MSAKPGGGLGRGLDLLFGEQIEAQNGENGVKMLKIETIEPNHDQPRKRFDEAALAELCDSIREHGVITPIAVRELDKGRYQIIAGERRYRAARMAGLSELPAIILTANDEQTRIMALTENLQREDLNPIEQANGFAELCEKFGLTQEEVARRVGKSRPAVANALRLLELSPPVRDMVEDGRLSAGHARALLSLNAENQLSAARRILSGNLSVREAEALVKRLKSPPKPEKRDSIYAAELSRELSRKLGRGVKVSEGKNGRGRVIIDYYDLDDLDRLVAILKGKQ